MPLPQGAFLAIVRAQQEHNLPGSFFAFLMFFFDQLFSTDKPARQDSAPSSATQAAIEEALSFDGPPDSLISIAGRTYLYFAGSGYLGLQADPEVLAATCEAVLRYGVGTATTRAAFTSPPVFEVERRIADMLGTERALYTASGYTANQILLEAIGGTYERIFIDEASHYSLFDAVRRVHGTQHGNRCQPIPFRHRDVNDLKEKLDGNLQFNHRPLVISDGVFSFQGTVAPVRAYLELLNDYDGSSLWLDDAHGFGVLGKQGRGVYENFDIDTALVNRTLQDAADDLGFSGHEEIGTKLYLSLSLGKAVGGGGGVLPGSESFIQRLKDRSAVFFGASAPASPVAAATAKALAMLVEPTLRNDLRRNAKYLKQQLRSIGLSLEGQGDDGEIPIVTISLGSAMNMRRIQKELSQQSVLISYLPRHAGLNSQGALRIAVFATHTKEMIDELVAALKKVL